MEELTGPKTFWEQQGGEGTSDFWVSKRQLPAPCQKPNQQSQRQGSIHSRRHTKKKRSNAVLSCRRSVEGRRMYSNHGAVSQQGATAHHSPKQREREREKLYDTPGYSSRSLRPRGRATRLH